MTQRDYLLAITTDLDDATLAHLVATAVTGLMIDLAMHDPSRSISIEVSGPALPVTEPTRDAGDGVPG